MAAISPRIKLDLAEETAFNSFSKWLFSSSSHTSVFGRYGVLASQTKFVKAQPRRQNYLIDQFRNRIRDFIEGQFKPTTLQDLINYLDEKFLTLEARHQTTGESTHYLIDNKSKRKVLASTVDPRLGRPGLARMFGSSLDQIAEKKAVEKEISPEITMANRLRQQNAMRLKPRSGSPSSPPFSGWDDMRFSAPALFRGLEMTMQGNEVWVGSEICKSTGNPDENKILIAKLKQQYGSLILPAKTKQDAENGILTPGMPILARQNSVRTRHIVPSLSMKNLVESFGVDPYTYFNNLHEIASSRTASLSSKRSSNARVIELSEFRKRFENTRRQETLGDVDLRKEIVKHFVVRDDAEKFIVFDETSGREFPFIPERMPAGKYSKQDGFGVKTGFIEIHDDGGYSVKNLNDQYDNPYGPAVVFGKGTDTGCRYAIDGVFLSKSDFMNRNKAAVNSYGYSV